MPPGTPFSSLIPPYNNIRVDLFTGAPSSVPPALHLLTHTHSDHIVGLSSKSFAQPIICSPDAKQMLLRHEVFTERALFDGVPQDRLAFEEDENGYQYRAERVRTFKHLKVPPTQTAGGGLDYAGSRDLLQATQLNVPTQFPIDAEEVVTITLVDANHCPGAVMFLIEGPRGAVLHTGDFRAERSWLKAIQRNPYLAPYLASETDSPRKTLDAIFLDTACLLSDIQVPTKKHATAGLIALLRLYPPETRFFINAWTWGYEDILLAIAEAFDTDIHVDRYKYSIYTHLSDPSFASIVTREPGATRFHACERFDRCSEVGDGDRSGGKHVVYINPVTMDNNTWEEYQVDTKRRLERRERVDCLLVPLSRHSPLPELQAFVKIFKPRRLHPNTLDPSLNGLDWLAMRKMFKGCLAGDTKEGICCPSLGFADFVGVVSGKGKGKEKRDGALENLIGDGVDDVAKRWAEGAKDDEDTDTRSRSGKRGKLDVLKEYLDDDVLGCETKCERVERRELVVIEGVEREVIVLDSDDGPGKPEVKSTAVPPQKHVQPRRPPHPHLSSPGGSEQSYETQRGYDDDEERDRTAHFLFGPLAGITSREGVMFGDEDWDVGKSSSPMRTPRAAKSVKPVPVPGPSRRAAHLLLTPRTSPRRERIRKLAAVAKSPLGAYGVTPLSTPSKQDMVSLAPLFCPLEPAFESQDKPRKPESDHARALSDMDVNRGIKRPRSRDADPTIKKRRREMKEEQWAISQRLADALDESGMVTEDFREKQRRRDGEKFRDGVWEEYKDGVKEILDGVVVEESQVECEGLESVSERVRRGECDAGDGEKGERVRRLMESVKESVEKGERVRLPRLKFA